MIRPEKQVVMLCNPTGESRPLKFAFPFQFLVDFFSLRNCCLSFEELTATSENLKTSQKDFFCVIPFVYL